MSRAIALLMLVAGVWVCPEMAWGQSKKPTAGSVPGPPSGSKPQAPQVSPKQPSRKSTTGTPSQPIAGKDFEDSSLGLVPNPQGPFKWIPPGTFQMGSTAATDNDRYSDETQHEVVLTHGFWMLDHEVTQKEYEDIKASTPSWFIGNNRPVERVTWHDAVDFCNKLTEKDREAGRIALNQEYRLPTEAEWEYACRAGTKGAVYVDYKDRYQELDAIAWWNWNSGNQTHPVKQKRPNAFGLHDMIGNVYEWCSDWYGAYPSGTVENPKGPDSGTLRVGRGAGWRDIAEFARSASRAGGAPSGYFNSLGFRPVLSPVRSAQ